MMPQISVVFGTLNRIEFLQRAVESARLAVDAYPYELVIVDGGSTDGTLEYLRAQEDVRLIEHGRKLGAVRAFNDGFHAARGEFVAAFNDDAEYVGRPVARAVELLTAQERIGQVAIQFATQILHNAEGLASVNVRNVAPRVQVVNTALYGQIPYANFGVIRRKLGEQVGWWGNYFQYGGDTELSVKVRAAGFEIAVLDKALGYIVHYELQDATRIPNVEQQQFNARWRQHVQAQQAQRTAQKPEPGAVLHAALPTSLARQPATPALTRARHDEPAPFVAPSPTRPIRITARFNEPQRVGMNYPTRMEYLGGKHGKVPFHHDGSRFTYIVSAANRQFWADGGDVEWLVKARDHGKPLFRVVEE